MQINCPHCSKLLKVPDTAAGKTVKCPACSNTFKIPAAAPASESAAPQAPAPAPASSASPTPVPPKPTKDAPATKKFKSLRKRSAAGRVGEGREQKAPTSADGKTGEGGEPPKKKGKLLKVLGIGCLILILLGGSAGYYVYFHLLPNLANIATDVVREGIVAVIKTMELPDDQEDGLIGHIDRVVNAYKEGDMPLEVVGELLEDLMESPIIPMAMVSVAETKYINPSDLSDDDKEEAKLDLQRLGRGVVEKKITSSDVDAVSAMICTEQEGGNKQLKETLTAEELSAFLAAVKEKADAADIPEEAYAFDPVAEFGKAVDEALGR